MGCPPPSLPSRHTQASYFYAVPRFPALPLQFSQNPARSSWSTFTQGEFLCRSSLVPWVGPSARFTPTVLCRRICLESIKLPHCLDLKAVFDLLNMANRLNDASALDSLRHLLKRQEEAFRHQSPNLSKEEQKRHWLKFVIDTTRSSSPLPIHMPAAQAKHEVGDVDSNLNLPPSKRRRTVCIEHFTRSI